MGITAVLPGSFYNLCVCVRVHSQTSTYAPETESTSIPEPEGFVYLSLSQKFKVWLYVKLWNFPTNTSEKKSDGKKIMLFRSFEICVIPL